MDGLGLYDDTSGDICFPLKDVGLFVGKGLTLGEAEFDVEGIFSATKSMEESSTLVNAISIESLGQYPC